MRRAAIVISLACIFGVGALMGAAWSETRRIAPGKAIYELWSGPAHAPLSIVVVRRCLNTEDGAGALYLIDYSRSRVKFGCRY